MLYELFSGHDYLWFAVALLVGLSGCQAVYQQLPMHGVTGARWRLSRLALTGLGGGLIAWTVFRISLAAYFPYLDVNIPLAAVTASVLLCVAGALASAAVATYGVAGVRNTVLAGSLLSSGISCALFVSMSALAQPLSLGYRLSVVLAVMLGCTALFGAGLRGHRNATRPLQRMLPTALIGVGMVVLNVGSLAAILPFSEWETATATPDALALQPITVVFFSEFIAVLLLVRAGAAVDRSQALRTRQENERLRQLTESTFEGILVYRAGVVLDANSALCRLVGLPLDAVKGRRLADLGGLGALADQTCAQPVELNITDRSGMMVPVETLSRDIVFDDGVARVAAVRDIRERRAAEQSERDHNRMLDLQHEAEELRERARIAAEANRAKSAFLAMMSHEIRTPMNAVLGLATVLFEDDLSADQRRAVLTIRESGEALLRILNDILDCSKLEAGRLTFEPIPFSPATLTQEAVSVQGPTAMAKGLTISADTDPGVPETLIGDAGRIRQVLMNLVSNAVKFTDVGTVMIRARCLGRQGDTVSMVWEVHDTGIGIPAEKIDHLFDEFMQADNSITRRFGGTGLGLFISRRIVEEMGGTIEVDSRPRLGSVFRFRLPLRQADTPVAAAPVRRDHAEALRVALQRLGRPAQVLLAEDNPTNQYVMTQLLRGFNLVMDVAGDGEAAVSAASAKDYDVVFMDMRMPRMDGLHATRAIRRLGGVAATVPIIALTANAFPDDVKACRTAGMTHFVAKPVASGVLFQTLEDALSKSDSAPSANPAGSSRSAGEEAEAADIDALNVLNVALGQDTVQRMIEIFFAETEARLARLADQPTDDDARLRDEVHALKGAAGTVGAQRLSQLAAAAEKRLINNGGLKVKDIAEMSKAFEAYREKVLRYILAPAMSA